MSKWLWRDVIGIALGIGLWVASLVDIRHRGYLAGFRDGVTSAAQCTAGPNSLVDRLIGDVSVGELGTQYLRRVRRWLRDDDGRMGVSNGN